MIRAAQQILVLQQVAEPALARALHQLRDVEDALNGRLFLMAGGCQAEVGSATAMAAAALTEVRGKTPECSLHAASLALKNMIGLACDPIGGLVEVPCIKRNGIGAVFAMSASDMAYLGVESFVPFDEVVRAMREVGDLMSPKIRETALGGLATTPTGQEVAKRMGLLHIGDNACSK